MRDDSQYLRAFIALGANLPSQHGSPLQTLEKAVAVLAEFTTEPLICSSFWQSEPLDCPPDSPVYTNAVISLVPCREETPLSLLQKLQDTERDFGRVRSGLRNEARVLDLDLVSFGTETSDTRRLTLPHPRAHERLFVLKPLQEVAPSSFRFPGIHHTLDELIADIQDQTIYKVDQTSD